MGDRPRPGAPNGQMTILRLLGLLLTLNLTEADFRPPGNGPNKSFSVTCPYCGKLLSNPSGKATCETCNKPFVVAPCICQNEFAGAAGRVDQRWYCGVEDKWFYARLCPMPGCRVLCTEHRPGGFVWRCRKDKIEFHFAKCEACGWLADQHPEGYLVCEMCGQHTQMKGS